MFHITEDCIACALCDRCPTGAILSGFDTGLDVYAIDKKCNGCPGLSVPVCVAVCPVDCIIKDYSSDEYEVGFKDPDPEVRFKFAKADSKFPLRLTLIESGLTDPIFKIRAATAERRDYVPTPLQVERGLTDADESVRLAFTKRQDITLNNRQIERGLLDPSAEVRAAVGKRKDFSPSPEQLERGLTDAHPYVRCTFAERSDCDFSASQIERGLKDDVIYVQLAFGRFLKKTPNQQASAASNNVVPIRPASPK